MANPEFVELWSAEDEDEQENTKASLDKILGEDYYQLSLENGPFSGYPTINLTIEATKKLYEALRREFVDEKHPEICGSQTDGLIKNGWMNHVCVCIKAGHRGDRVGLLQHECHCGMTWIEMFKKDES